MAAASADDGAKCEHCLTGHIHKGVPSHGVSTIGGVAAYVAPGATPGRAIVIATDIFGHELPNVRLIADKMAAVSGYTVVVPDILQGDALIPNQVDWSTFPAWRAQHGDEATMPPLTAVLADLREGYGMDKVAIQGYCFGGRYAALCAKAGLVQAYGVAHPSFIQATDFTSITTVPGIFLCAETDQQFPADMANAVEAGLKEAGVACEFRRYPGTTHGFAVRGSEDDAVVAAAKEDALQGAAAFFMRHLE